MLENTQHALTLVILITRVVPPGQSINFTSETMQKMLGGVPVSQKIVTIARAILTTEGWYNTEVHHGQSDSLAVTNPN